MTREERATVLRALAMALDGDWTEDRRRKRLQLIQDAMRIVRRITAAPVVENVAQKD